MLFDSLNDRQIEAVKAEQKRILVLAGAGSGKTKTLLQKIKYLVEVKKVQPSEILAITFTKNAANEMLDRLIIESDKTGIYESIIFDKKTLLEEKNRQRFLYVKKFKWIENLTIRTFHSLCYKIMQNYGVKEFDNKFKIISDDKKKEEDPMFTLVAPETTFEVFHKIIIRNCEKNNDYLLTLKKYILDYVVDKIQVEKYKNFNLYPEGKIYTTLRGEKVRSKSEQYIADWLFRHNIGYQYEPQINIKDFGFKPDFYIEDANIYLEHVSDKSYPSKNKAEQFEKGNILCVKTFEKMTEDTALFNHALDKIIKGRLSENYISDRILSYQEEFNRYQEEVKDFIFQAIRICDMLKVEDSDWEKVYEKSQDDQHERIRVFYQLVMPLVQEYQNYCIDKSYLDFNDMIIRTVSLFKKHKDILQKFQNQYQYVLVDEFQDVNSLQVALIKQLVTPKTQLFCVGDDWQSIYGFRGSNVDCILNFDKHFKRSKTIKLNLNYRSTQSIVGASNEVIKHNKFKIEKEIFASKMSEFKIVEYAGNNQEENVDFCVERVRELLENGYKNDDILFLYRRSKMYYPYFMAFRNENIKVQSKTIHASKGLEAKAVFIVGLTDGYGGFPDIWLEDRIFQVIKTANHDSLMEEERRLFYVAITRAKDQLYLITEKGNTSRFLKEIPDEFKTSFIENTLKSESFSICKKCSKQVEKQYEFCPFCGKKKRFLKK
uniref:UvrD-helicase domain-containing protein n=1 Tax=Flavobacterium sp. TaxID=239 RepID=UPI00404B1DDE